MSHFFHAVIGLLGRHPSPEWDELDVPPPPRIYRRHHRHERTK